MVRLTRFLRSVGPKDPWQLIFLLGVVCLVVSRRSSWILAKLDGSVGHPFHSGTTGLPTWLLGLCFYPLIFASCAGYFACFWQVKRRFVAATVIAPAVAALGAIAYLLYAGYGATQSIFESRAGTGMFFRWFGANLRNFPPAFDLAILGLMLCLLFLSRAAFGVSVLPLSLTEMGSLDDGMGSWRGLKTAIFLLLGPQFLLARIFATVLFLLQTRFGADHYYLNIAWSVAGEVLGSFAFLGVPMLFLGRTAWEFAKSSLRLPRLRYVALGLVSPVVVAALARVGEYLLNRAGWVAHLDSELRTPQIDWNGVVAYLYRPELLLTCIAAFGEEIVNRGILLPLLMRRYGLHRGVFFTGLIWAAGHFPFDSYTHQSVLGVGALVLHRILICATMNYVLAWLTLRARSIIPAGFAHALSNAFIFAGVVDAGWGYARVVLWGILAYVLWRYWPITDDTEPLAGKTEPAVRALGLESAV